MSMQVETAPGKVTQDWVSALDELIVVRKKMTNRLYQVVLEGEATLELLRQFVIHRYPIKNFWTRNILGIASRIDDYGLRRELVENIYEEETGALSRSRRHLETFVEFGQMLGLSSEQIVAGPVIEETRAVIEHNVRACNSHDVHFTEGVASVLLLMEGQPPIVDRKGRSMATVMRDVYGLPRKGFEYFIHHASSDVTSDHVSELEDDHAATARNILRKYCTTPEMRQRAHDALTRALNLRHRHFDAILRLHYREGSEPFRFGESSV